MCKNKIDINKLKNILKKLASENPDSKLLNDFFNEDDESLLSLSFRYFFWIIRLIGSEEHFNEIDTAYLFSNEVIKIARNTNDILRMYKLFFIKNTAFRNKEFRFKLIRKADELADNFSDYIRISYLIERDKVVKKTLVDKFFEKSLESFMNFDEKKRNGNVGFCMLGSLINKVVKRGDSDHRNILFEIVRKAEEMCNCVIDFITLYEIVSDPDGEFRDSVWGFRLLKEAEDIAQTGDDYIDIACAIVEDESFLQDKIWATSLFRKGIKLHKTFQGYTLEQIAEIIDFELDDKELEEEIQQIKQMENVL